MVALENVKTKYRENVKFLLQAIDEWIHSSPVWNCKLEVNDKSAIVGTIVQWYSTLGCT